jgi:hypothetical protein
MTLMVEDTDVNQPNLAIFSEEVDSGATGSRSSTPSVGSTHAGVLFGIKATG